MIRLLTISGVRSIGIYIYISYNFIKVKVKYSRPNWLSKFIKEKQKTLILGQNLLLVD